MDFRSIHLKIVKHLINHTFKFNYKKNDIEDILWDVAYNCSKLLELEDFVFYIFDTRRRVFVQKAAYGYKDKGQRKIQSPITIKYGEGIVGHVGKTLKPEIIEDCSLDSRYILDDHKRLSEITVPMILNDQIIGVLDSEHSKKAFFNHQHLDILESVASICAVKVAEMQANASNENLAAFFNEAKHPKIRITRTGKILNRNKAAKPLLKQWGVSNKQIKNTRILDTLNSVAINNKEIVIEDKINKHILSLRFVNILKKGYINVTGTDITDLKLAKNESEKANKVKDEFLSVISHEIRTPLNAIIGSLNLLKSNTLTPEQEEYIKIADFASEKLLNLLKDILNVRQIEANKLKLNNVHFNLKELVNNIKKTFAFEAKYKNNTLTFNIDGSTDAQFYSDEVKIFQALNNILSNAIKFTENGDIAVSVFLDKEKDNLCNFRFEVSDTGIGIPSHKQELIFQPFERAENATSRKHEGTGLGLSIVKNIIDLLDGHIVVNSEEGKGTTFVYHINIMRSATDTVNKKLSTVNFNTKNLEGVTVLLVDDNQINLRISEHFLKKWGATTIKALDGLEAIEIFETNNTIDIILMDLHMPKCNGFEATKRIRNLKHPNFNIPIIAITADITEHSKKEAFQVGVNDIIPKPFKPEDFVNAIEALIHNK